MEHQQPWKRPSPSCSVTESSGRAPAGRRKQHPNFLADALESSDSSPARARRSTSCPILESQPRPFVLGLSRRVEGATMLAILAAHATTARSCCSVHPTGRWCGRARARRGARLAMLPALATPFARATCATAWRVSCRPTSRPTRRSTSAGGQPVARALVPAEARRGHARRRRRRALVRMRHPAWGVVPPAYFVPDDGDPHFRALSEFVIGRCIHDWHDFLSQHGRRLAVSLPVDFLLDPESLRILCQQCRTTRLSPGSSSRSTAPTSCATWRR